MEDFIKYRGGRILNFLEKNVDAIIMDVTLLRKAPCVKLPRNKFTRSQQLIAKARKSGTFSVESFASKWSIPIIDHKEILYYCNKALNRQEIMHVGHIIKKLQAPFIKVEDQSRKYRPEFVEFKCFPFIDTTVPMSCSPFDTWCKQTSTANKYF